MEQCIRQNNAIEIYEGYFESTDDATRADIIFSPRQRSAFIVIQFLAFLLVSLVFLKNFLLYQKRI